MNRVLGLGNRVHSLVRRLSGQVALARSDPEQLGRNLLQITDPLRFETRLLDVLEQAPLHLSINSGRPTLNVLQPVLDPNSMTGGPNTIVLLAALIAEQDTPVRLVTNRPGHQPDPAWFATHLASLLRRPAPASLSVTVASDPSKPASVGAKDTWLATHWTTAQGLKPVLHRMRRRWFFYLVQDFEPGFYAWSSNYALALETYTMDFYAIINEKFLAQHLVAHAVGRFAEPRFLAQRCRVFEPAVDRKVFHPPVSAQAGPTKTLLFYARPTNPRNMVGIGVHALREAIAVGAFGPNWRFLAIGSRNSMPRFNLGKGHTLEPVVWQDYQSYADALGAADVLLCLMLSPHTSYPVLEMAACGGRVVTNTYGAKTAKALAELSPSIYPAPPTVEGITAALIAASEVAAPARRIDQLMLPSSWEEVLNPIARWIITQMNNEDIASATS